MESGLGFFSLLLVDYIIVSFVLVVAAATYLKLNRMQSVYQRALVRKVNKIKERQNAYVNEKDESKLTKLEKKHAKAVKRLEKRIKRIMFFNKNIIITNSNLIDETNLALPHQTPFTFNSKLDEMINAFNEKHKRHKTINAEKKGKAITAEVETQEEVLENDKVDALENVQENAQDETVARSLTPEESQEFEEVHQISFDDLLQTEEVKSSTTEVKKSDLAKDIYKDQSDDKDDLYTM